MSFKSDDTNIYAGHISYFHFKQSDVTFLPLHVNTPLLRQHNTHEVLL